MPPARGVGGPPRGSCRDRAAVAGQSDSCAAGPYADLADLRARILACRRCPRMPDHLRRVPGAGPPVAAALLLGEAPGRLGAGRSGVPFSGDRSGLLLRGLLAELGVDPAAVWLTNVVKCNPLDAHGRNRAPTAGERAACRGFWQAEAALLRPRLLVPLGEAACREVTGRSLALCVNRTVATPHGPARALYHPGYVVRHRYPRGRYRADLARALAEAGLLPRGRRAAR